MVMLEMREASLYCLLLNDPQEKSEKVTQLFTDYVDGKLNINFQDLNVEISSDLPGRPLKPELVDPLSVKKRSMHTPEGRASLLHSLAHIEFNAINLALDAIWRYSQMPREFYEDWLRVAKEEAYHYTLISNRLRESGFSYGDFPAHNSLWEMAQKTQESVLARMALVPRTMESRGLDAVPAIRDRFLQIKDDRTVQILEIILRDEIGHVAIGNRWFNYLCKQNNLDPIVTYSDLAKRYKAPVLRGPFNLEARAAAGFSDKELEMIQSQAN